MLFARKSLGVSLRRSAGHAGLTCQLVAQSSIPNSSLFVSSSSICSTKAEINSSLPLSSSTHSSSSSSSNSKRNFRLQLLALSLPIAFAYLDTQTVATSPRPTFSPFLSASPSFHPTFLSSSSDFLSSKPSPPGSAGPQRARSIAMLSKGSLLQPESVRALATAIQSLLGRTTAQVSLTPTEWIYGIGLLYQQGYEDIERLRKRLDQQQHPSSALLVKYFLIWQVYAAAAYKRKPEAFFKYLNDHQDCTFDLSNDLLSYSDTAQKCQPAYYFLKDTHHKRLVLCIRGTKSLDDALSDVAVDMVPFLDGYAHCGMAECSIWLLGEISEQLKEYEDLLKDGEYSIVCTGHSLGAGVATLATLLLQSLGFESTRAVVFATPACLSPYLSIKAASYVDALVLGDDCIPRASEASFIRMMQSISQLTKDKWDQDSKEEQEMINNWTKAIKDTNETASATFNQLVTDINETSRNVGSAIDTALNQVSQTSKLVGNHVSQASKLVGDKIQDAVAPLPTLPRFPLPNIPALPGFSGFDKENTNQEDKKDEAFDSSSSSSSAWFRKLSEAKQSVEDVASSTVSQFHQDFKSKSTEIIEMGKDYIPNLDLPQLPEAPALPNLPDLPSFKLQESLISIHSLIGAKRSELDVLYSRLALWNDKKDKKATVHDKKKGPVTPVNNDAHTDDTDDVTMLHHKELVTVPGYHIQRYPKASVSGSLQISQAASASFQQLRSKVLSSSSSSGTDDDNDNNDDGEGINSDDGIALVLTPITSDSMRTLVVNDSMVTDHFMKNYIRALKRLDQTS